MTNRLRDETSPYLLQHADNPVDWWPWGPEALAHASETGKPILLSVGYAACHWCHVMAHESFEDDEIAALMNRLFVNVKVDREERPDIDQIYMSALQALGVHGGWPMTMFLTPDGVPFWGGTYFPKTSRYGQPAFADILNGVAASLAQRPDQVAENRKALMAHLSRRDDKGPLGLDGSVLDLATDKLLSIMDPINGGFRGAPKFPQAPVLDLMLRSFARRRDPGFLDTVLLTLERIANGGIYDHLGGGFSRYSVDDRWLVPHFEKMLYDNGQLLGLFARAYAATGSSLFRRRIEETVTWLGREMLLPEGAFAASLDADTEGEEGRVYVWSRAEIVTELGPQADQFAAVYDVTEAGNWEGVNVLNRLQPSTIPVDEDQLARLRMALLTARMRRVQPGRDDKILADWNALAISGLAIAAIALRRDDWLDLAITAYRGITATMARDGRLGHSARGGRLVFPGMATDHAAMAVAALDLHQATFDPLWLEEAARWLDALDRHHRDENGLYFMSADDAPGLIVRPRSILDEATPNANGLAADASVRLHLLTGEARHLDRADAIFTACGGAVARNVVGTASLMAAFTRRLDLASVVIVGEAGPDREALLTTARTLFPEAVPFVAESTEALGAGHPAHGKTAIDGRPAAYLCRSSTCSLPVTTPEDLAALDEGQAAEDAIDDAS
ncbi:thioredoxin domain-containing protein [Methylobrevis pamukkalensis]|uniref:Spermatogenesis-associated protein 20-like TRX domain-containing protein n=1 Tax=Methylobrevis pamukkalensis TaxID=1439726 RepID=A0A1E3H744_9HYPH|nr:thioredoxin domain-containing protein [Methylobrevis pamukkalensis]ODN72124.1 hypothetical protein A6302_00528 [Methylobrevis pamukkalensis]